MWLLPAEEKLLEKLPQSPPRAMFLGIKIYDNN
jgi:hypothetical protein